MLVLIGLKIMGKKKPLTFAEGLLEFVSVNLYGDW